MALLETINLCKYFGGLKANHNISLQVEAGQIYGLIGPNGAGKTTFLNAISGVSSATSGQIFFDGEDVTNAKSYEMCQKGLARTFQIVRSFRDLPVLENVVVGAIFGAGLSRAEAEKAAVKNLEFVNFPLDYNTKASALNTIQLKKVEMARALSCGCKMLLLDEVAAGLTPFELSEIAQLIKRIRDDLGITIIIVEHLMKLIMDVCDELAVLYFGELLATGTPSEVSANEKVIKAYLGDNYML